MNFLDLFQKINKKKKVLEYKDTSDFFDEQFNSQVLNKILEKHNYLLSDLNEDKISYLERSLFQFEAIKSFGKQNSVIKNMAYFFAKYPMIIYLLLFKRNRKIEINSRNVLLLHNLHQKNRENVLPEEYTKNEKYLMSNYTLNFKDIKFLFYVYKNIENKFYYAEFYLKLIYNIAKLSDINKNFKNKNLLNSFEYSYCSSLCTQYLNENNNKHINIMHGEKLFYVRDSFSKFNEFYVWGEYYKDLFLKLGMEKSQFKIYTNPHFSLLNNMINNENKNVMTLYWTPAILLNEQLIQNIFKEYDKYELVIRYHPSYKDLFFNDFEKISQELKDIVRIEDPNEMSIINSLLNTNLVIGTYSTVMMEGFVSGKQIYFLEDNIIEKIKKYYPIYSVNQSDRSHVLKYVFNIWGEK